MIAFQIIQDRNILQKVLRFFTHRNIFIPPKFSPKFQKYDRNFSEIKPPKLLISLEVRCSASKADCPSHGRCVYCYSAICKVNSLLAAALQFLVRLDATFKGFGGVDASP